jgi:hypothetical protein
MSHRVFFRHLRSHTDELVSPATYDTVTSYVLGYDAGTGGTALAGFLEWLAMKSGRPAATWPQLVAELAFDGLAPPKPYTGDEDRVAINAVFYWLDMFLHETGEAGQRDVFRRFETWEGERRSRDG